VKLSISIFFLFCILTRPTFAQKINGVNFVAERSFIQSEGFDDLKPLNAKWVAWIPYAFCEANSGKLMHELSWQWAGETKTGTIRAIELARKKGLKVMVKPHVWMSDNSFTGKIDFDDDKWEEWQAGYTNYIIQFARLAEENKVELFCLGTEHYASISCDNAYWFNLIQQVRKVYKGKITYAANWDSYHKIPFWTELDYIGVDAYFPLSDKSQPSIKYLETRWSTWKSKLFTLSKAFDRPVLFTEYGYRCTQFNCKDPWVDVTEDLYCEDCQHNALNAMFNSFWAEDWFAGGFLWKWFEPNKSFRHESNKSYSVKGKLAVSSVSRAFKRTN
jgi:hypothetical protein